jgi:hypothetical protein
MTKKLVGVQELAEILSVPPSWIYSRTRMKDSDSIPVTRCGKYCRFNVDAVFDWLQRQNEATP